MIKIKKVIGAALACTLCVTALAACGDKENNAVTQETEYDSSEVVMTINGQEISTDLYRYYITQTAMSEVASRNPEFTGDFTTVDWNEKVDGDKTLADVIEEKTMNELKGMYALMDMDAAKDIKLTDEEKAQTDAMINQVREAQGEEVLDLAIRQMGVTSEEEFKNAYNVSSLYAKVENDIADNRDKYITPELEPALAEYKNDETITAQHILIKNDSEKYSDPKATIDEVHKRALAGEDFNGLMKEFNEDPGQGAGGYTFGRGYMVPEFETAAFALDYNQISDVVPSSYGYHVIKRIIGPAELKLYLAENAETEINEEAMNKISVADIMSDVAAVTNQLNTMMGGSTNG